MSLRSVQPSSDHVKQKAKDDPAYAEAYREFDPSPNHRTRCYPICGKLSIREIKAKGINGSH